MSSKTIYTPYTYLIGWSSHKKYYYGVRYAKDCHPSDLWSSYFTSSKYVHEFREEHGEPDVIVVRKTFVDSKKAIEWETKVLQRLNVVESELWINKTQSRAISIDHTWNNDKYRNKMMKSRQSTEYKNKLSDSIKSLWKNDDYCQKVRRSRKESVAVKEHLRDNNILLKNKWETDEEFREKQLEIRNKQLQSPEHRAKVSKSASQYMWITNNIINRRILKSDEIPTGFKRGRTITWQTLK